MDLQLSQQGAALGEGCNQVPVELYGTHLPNQWQELCGDSPLSWSDLYQMLTGLWVDYLYDALNNRWVVKEVLAKSFSGAMIQGVILTYA
jgi:hypothetical protein